MRLFVCEFITGGGMRSQALPPGLLHDAQIMFDALLSDLRELTGLELITTHDDRLDAVPESVAGIGVDENIWEVWHRCMRTCDAVWFIAPETGGILLEIRALADRAGCKFIGCSMDAIQVTSSKKHCADYLNRSAVRCIRTEFITGPLPRSRNGWVVKPDDGAGSAETFYFESMAQIEAWKKNTTLERFVVQPYVEGIPGSLSAIYFRGQCRLLACNRQRVTFVDHMARYEGVSVHALQDKYEELKQFAGNIGTVMPGLAGYVGIDFIYTDTGPVLVEINPRLTAAYAGLRTSLPMNVAGVILDVFAGQPLPETLNPHPVSLRVTHAG